MTDRTLNRKIIHILGPILALLLFGVALWVLHHFLEHYHYRQLVEEIRAIPAWKLAIAALLAVADYSVLTLYDMLACHYIRAKIPYSRISIVSFIGYAFSNNVGLANLAGGSIRYRFYSAWGLSPLDIAKIIGFIAITFWLGFLAMIGACFVWEPGALPATLKIPMPPLHLVGAIALLIVALYAIAVIVRRKPIRIRSWEFSLPSWRLLPLQLAIAVTDWTLVSWILYVLLPEGIQISFVHYLQVFLLSHLVGLLSHVPGELGVFETVMMVNLSDRISSVSLFGALILFRAIYYLLPLILGLIVLTIHEAIQQRERAGKMIKTITDWAPGIVPQILALATFVSGTTLLFSGATPEMPERFRWIREFVPLSLVELSHFLSSLAGMGLLLLARGLQRRLNIAYTMAIGLLVLGIVVSIQKGLDFEEATILGIVLLALLPCRRHFTRKASLLSQPFTAGWILAIAIVICSSIWLGFFSFKHVAYSSELWWQFAFHGQASRFMRATVGVLCVALFFSAARLMRSVPPEPVMATEDDLEDATDVLQKYPETYPHLVYLKDKQLLFNEERDAFIMYGVHGRSWVAIKDPVGAESKKNELIWQFRELCSRHEGWPVFYQVNAESLPYYLDQGLTLLKLGEEAIVDLPSFCLTGNKHKNLRYWFHKTEGEGCVFEVIPAERVEPLLPELKAISDAWLESKTTREKRFTLGFFDEDYLKRLPIAVIHWQGRIVAFANIWQGAPGTELSIDLMRYHPDSPKNIMEYLLVNLMLWGKEQNYDHFNLGMAPLSGLENRAMAPLWNRLGALMFQHGEHFYGFQGLREYKEKFDPVWRPKYMASPGGLALPQILADVTFLISGGIKGAITR